MHAISPIARAVAAVATCARRAILRACVLGIAGCGAAQAVALSDPASVDLGAAFVAQQRSRSTPTSFSPPAVPGGGESRGIDAARSDAPHAFVRYRVGYPGAARLAASLETQALAGVRWHRALLIHETGDGPDRTRTSLTLDWPEASTRLTMGDLVAVRPAGNGEPLRLSGLAVRRATALPWDLPSLAPAPGTTALSGEMTLSADGDGGYVAAVRQDAAPLALPDYVTGFAASMSSPRAPTAASFAGTGGLDRALPARPPAGSTAVEYAIGAARSNGSPSSSMELREAFIASLQVGVTSDLSVGAQAEGRDGRRDGAVGVAIALGSAGAVRGSVGGTRSTQGDACATGVVDYRVSHGGIELAAAYARAPFDIVPLRADAAPLPVQALGGRLRVALNATDSVAIATDRTSSADAAPYTSTRVTFRRALAPTVAVDGIVGYVSGGTAAAGPGPEGWLASLNVRWSLDPARPLPSF